MLHACTAPWPYENDACDPGQPLKAPFYARGLFAHRCLVMGGRNGVIDEAVRSVFLGVCGLCDQPLRTIFGGSLGSGTTYAVAANERVLDATIGNSLWSASSHLCGLSDELAYP